MTVYVVHTLEWEDQPTWGVFATFEGAARYVEAEEGKRRAEARARVIDGANAAAARARYSSVAPVVWSDWGKPLAWLGLPPLRDRYAKSLAGDDWLVVEWDVLP